MYLFDSHQWKWIVTCLCILLMVSAFISNTLPVLIKSILLLAGGLGALSIWVSHWIGKRTSVLILFLITIFISFSHFLLGFSKDTGLVAVIYSFSILTLFTLLVTNFKESNLINN